MLMYGGGLLALSAIVLSLLSPRFDGRTLALNLGAIAIGLVMGKAIGRVMFRLPAAGAPGSNASKRRS
jgi:hypothetical protein